MSHTYTCMLMHAIFSTKERERNLNAELRPKLFSYMGGIINKKGGHPILVNGVEDHVHVFADLPANIAPADMVQHVKGGSSYWLNRLPNTSGKFAWQVGYSAFSVSASKRAAVVAYIAKQEQHHRKMSFKEEVLKFLEEYGVQYDERHLWD